MQKTTEERLYELECKLKAYEERRIAHNKKISDGLKKRKSQGLTLGRPSKKDENKFAEVLQKYYRGEISSTNAGKALGVTKDTFTRWIRENQKKTCAKGANKLCK